MHRKRARVVRCLLALGLSLVLSVPFSVSLGQTITSSGLNTSVSAPTALPGGQTQFDITGGTRPGGGVNLFHSFGNFNVPNNNIANFLNNCGLPTSNILGRVNGGNVSNIFGTIQTTGFGNANLFLMNPAGFLFGPNATLNVGGMVSFTSADYLRLADGVRFNAIPNTAADALLSAAPVAAFGFLGSNPGMITVQGSQLTVAEGTGISIVGGDISIQGGTLTAPGGQINLVSVRSPSKPRVGGEVIIGGSGPGATLNPMGFAKFGSITLSQGSTIDVSADFTSGAKGGNVVIRGGQFVMDDSSIKTTSFENDPFENQPFGAAIEVTAEQITISNSTLLSEPRQGASITLVSQGSLDILDSSLSASGTSIIGIGGTVDLNAGTSINLTGTGVTASSAFIGGSISLEAPIISLRSSTLRTSTHKAGTITLTGTKRVTLSNGTVLDANAFDHSGTIQIDGGAQFTSRESTIFSTDSIQVKANNIALTDTQISAVQAVGEFGGAITVIGNNIALARTHISASPIGPRSGGTIEVQGNKVELTNSQLTTANRNLLGAAPGGSITVEAKTLKLTNSQILSTAKTGDGGTITITSPNLRQNAGSVFDASSQSGADGTVTINGVVQP
jgi:filamentous hemagglutinin family protein